ncbi:MAG: hypothetical protein ACXABG_12975 [Promethearchaeota archaeon]
MSFPNGETLKIGISDTSLSKARWFASKEFPGDKTLVGDRQVYFFFLIFKTYYGYYKK